MYRMIGIGWSVESSIEQGRMVKTVPNGVLTLATSSTYLEGTPPVISLLREFL
jgi:hypothetical protein